MEFQYRAGDARSPSTVAAAATSANSESAATRVQDDYGGDGSGSHGENSEAVAPPPASDPADELRRQAAKDRIRERILREEAETLALEAEVRRELMEELRSQLARSARAGACAKGSETRADSTSLKTPIGHESVQIGSEAGVSAALQANKRKTHHVAAASNVSAATSNKKQKPDLTCTVCGITATSEGALQEHLKGKNHARKAAKLAPPLAGAGHHEVCSKVNGPAACSAKGKGPTLAVASTVFAPSNNIEQKPDLTCTVCGITSTSQKALRDHLDGKLHKRKSLMLSQTIPKEDVVTKMVCSEPNASAAALLLPAKRKNSHAVTAASTVSAAAGSEKEKQDLTCTVCGITATSEKGMQDHLKGKAHTRKAAAAFTQPPPPPPPLPEKEAAEQSRQEETEEEGAYTPRRFSLVTPSKSVCPVVQMNGFLLCEVCDVKAADLVTMVCHLQGGKHISKARQQEEKPPKAVAVVDDAVASGGDPGLETVAVEANGSDPGLETVAVEANGVCRMDGGFLLCELCNVKAPSQAVMRSHLSGKKHTNKQKAAVVDAGKAVLARDETNKDVAVGTGGDIAVTTPGQQAKKADAPAAVGDSDNSVGGMPHVVETVDGLLHRQNASTNDKEKAKVSAVDVVGAGGKRAVLAEAKSKEAASVTGHGTDESMEKPAVENMEVVPSATPGDDGATPVCVGSSVAPMEVDEDAEAGDVGAAKAEEDKQVGGQEVKMQVEGSLFIVLRQADGSLSCGLCGHHGCDKDAMVGHLYTGEHWRRARLSEQSRRRSRQGRVAPAAVNNDSSDGVVVPVK
uniref:Uncharacterized protein n=1 Tax=Avena sativa TaxID=4498 RepID=A0ACD5YZ95_AVESA